MWFSMAPGVFLSHTVLYYVYVLCVCVWGGGGTESYIFSDCN